MCVFGRDALFRLSLLRRRVDGTSEDSVTDFMSTMLRLLEVEPSDVDARIGAGLSFLDQKRFEDARDLFKRLVEVGRRPMSSRCCCEVSGLWRV